MAKILIAGGSGFLGQALAAALAREGHDIVLLTRGKSSRASVGVGRPVIWTPDGTGGSGAESWATELNDALAVVNLAGESIAGRRWTAAQKQRIRESRVLATRSLIEAIRCSARPPSVFISGSGVGYYGPLGDQAVTEAAPAGHDFLADVCVRWEAEAVQTAGLGTRVVCVRTGLVLDRSGGALPQMLPPFRFGVGGKVGSGRQYWPWIHKRDWVDLVRFAIKSSAIEGPVNATGPRPVTNLEFARALGRALRRPAFMPAPGAALKLLLGEMAEGLLLSGQRALPAKAERHGFVFTFKTIDDALDEIFGL